MKRGGNGVPPPDLRSCNGCIYAGRAGKQPICEYILKTQRRRPCPPGAGCTVKRMEERSVPVKSDWDRERARQLLEEGKTDLEAADAVDCTLTAFRSWKYRAGLAKAKREGTPPAGKDTPAEAPEVKKVRIPVGISICLFSCDVSVEAPDIDSAIRALDALRGVENGG